MDDTSSTSRAADQQLDGAHLADDDGPSDFGTRPLPFVSMRSWPRADGHLSKGTAAEGPQRDR